VFRVFREVKGITTSDEKSLGVTGERKLRSIIFVIIESGMTLSAIQLTRFVMTATKLPTAAADDAFGLIAGMHIMLNVTLSSVVAAGPNLIPETGSISQDEGLRIGLHANAIPEIKGIEETRDNDIDGNDSIQIVDR
jgi:hypothetical protein